MINYLKSLEMYCNDSFYINKLDNVYLEALKLINSTFPYNFFFTYLNNDIKNIFISNKLPKRDENANYKNIPVAKAYEVIDDYHHIVPEVTQERVKTAIETSCDGNFCGNIESLGPHNLENGSWNSDCMCRRINSECNIKCLCSIDSCKNRSYKEKKFLKLGEDVIEKYSWGMDLYTFRNLMSFMPYNFEEQEKSAFIEKILIPELSNNAENGWDVRLALSNLLEKMNKNSNNYYLSFHLCSMYDNSPASRKSFTAFCKGLGIFCNKIEGIKRNELIAPYLGEVYPQWYWFEKQDLIKSKNLDKELPDFYNIQLEKLKTDPSGYDLLMIDPNNKGNFASRMSHCCKPNCQTVTMISDSKYFIGMFSVGEVSFGEELTFDYNSITEKEKEFKEAICLCGSYYCRGHYLIFSNGKNFNEIINSEHSFLQRNAVLFDSCISKSDCSIANIIYFLKSHHMSDEFISKSPLWLIKWTARVIQYYNNEAKQMPFVRFLIDRGYKLDSVFTITQLKEKCRKVYLTEIEIKQKEKSLSELSTKNSNLLVNDNLSNISLSEDTLNASTNNCFDNFLANIEKEYSFLCQGLKDSRLQNMYITIDKVIHVLELMNVDKNESPIVYASEDDLFDFFWSKNDYSLRQMVLQNIVNLLDKGTDYLNKGIIRVIEILNESCINVQEAREKLIEVSKIFAMFSKDPISNKLAAFDPLSDIIFLYAKTVNYFKHNNEYQNPESSVNISILQRDISTTSKVSQSCCMTQSDLNKIIAEGAKNYDKQYIWGQLVGWFKQTVNKPDASLACDKKGCLVYPDLDCFFLSNIAKIQDKENELEANINPKSIKSSRIEIHSTRKNKSNKFIKTGLSENDVIFNYPLGNDRNTFLDRLLNTPFSSWPSHNRWCYKNKSKLIGSVQLDYYLEILNVSSLDNIELDLSVNMNVESSEAYIRYKSIIKELSERSIIESFNEVSHQINLPSEEVINEANQQNSNDILL